VDPEEMPYMIDLHLFLGRKPTNADSEGAKPSYDLNEMTPEMVQYGSLPNSVLAQEVENVQRLVSSEFTGSNKLNH
jgi:ATP-dependent RNA helicase DDX54/DBP10